MRISDREMIHFIQAKIDEFVHWVACRQFFQLEIETVNGRLEMFDISTDEKKAWTVFLYVLAGGPSDDFQALLDLLPNFPQSSLRIPSLSTRLVGFRFRGHRKRASVGGETHLQTASKAIQDYVRIVSQNSNDGTQRGFFRKMVDRYPKDPFDGLYSYLCSKETRVHSFGPTSCYDFLVTLDGAEAFGPDLRLPPRRLYLEKRSHNLVRGLQRATGDSTIDKHTPDGEREIEPLTERVREMCGNTFDIRDLETALCEYGKGNDNSN